MIHSYILSNDSPSSITVKVLLTILTLFIIGAFLGYVIEVLFRRFFSVKKWVNPGFMKGPWLPMYGFGLIFLFFLCDLFYSCLPDSMVLYNPRGQLFSRTITSGPAISDLLVIFTLALTMIGLEFFAGLIFVKGFKVRLWDYTNMKGNILGIICPVFNLIWFIVAVVYYYGINPFVYKGFHLIYEYLFGSSETGAYIHFGTIFILGMIYGIFVIDLIKSINLFNKVKSLTKESGVIQKYEKLREQVRLSQEDIKKKFFEKLPEALKNKKKENNKITEKIYENVRSAILIDPSIKDTKGNYDENGRPIKEE